MKIIVCIKQIQDPEIAATLFRVDEGARKVIPVRGLRQVVSPFDEQAVEAALRIRDAAGEDSGIEITVVTMGPESVRTAVKAALALGADRAVMLTDDAFADSDGYATARALAETIRKIDQVDLVLTGRQAADWDAGIVGAGSSIPYCASKAALIVMPKSLARTLGPAIRVNAVAPGFIVVEWLQQGLG